MLATKERYVFALLCSCLLFCISNCFLYFPLWAGNKEPVEERVQELDRLNKQIVRTIPDTPRYGQIDLKAKVLQKNGTVSASIQVLSMGTTATKAGNTETKSSTPQK